MYTPIPPPKCLVEQKLELQFSLLLVLTSSAPISVLMWRYCLSSYMYHSGEYFGYLCCNGINRSDSVIMLPAMH